MRQADIIKQLKTVSPEIKIDQTRISRIQNGKIKIPYPIAVVLAELFPEKTVSEWKSASGNDFKQAFSQKEAA